MPSRRAAAERLPFARSSARKISCFSSARHRRVQRQVSSLSRVSGALACPFAPLPRLGGQVERVDDLAAAQHRRALEDVEQLAHVARPVVGEQPRHRLLGDRARRRAAQRVRDQQRDVAAPRAQRRHLDLDHRQPVVEILAQRARRSSPGRTGRLVAATMRARWRQRLVAADALERPVLQHAQELGLQRRIEVADLVEEQRAAAPAASKRPLRRAVAPVKAPRSWPNSSLSISVGGSAARLTGDERLARARRVVVDGARDQLLAGAGLAGDEHRRVEAAARPISFQIASIAALVPTRPAARSARGRRRRGLARQRRAA